MIQKPKQSDSPLHYSGGSHYNGPCTLVHVTRTLSDSGLMHVVGRWGAPTHEVVVPAGDDKENKEG